MKALIRLIGVFTLVAIFTLPTSAVSFAVAEDWAAYMTVTTDPDIGSVPGEGYHFGFGAKDGATDEYVEADGDEIAPPDPLEGVNAYFYYPGNSTYTQNLITSIVAPATSITWPLVVKRIDGTGDVDMTISWPDISTVPGKYIVLELQDTGGNTLADMRTATSYTFTATPNELYSFQIKAEVGPDTMPPTVSDGWPTGSDVAVDSDISVTFSEPMDEASAESAFSIVPDASGSFSWDGNTMTFDASANLAYDTEYTVTVAGTAEDLSGNGLDGDEDGTAEGSPIDDYSWSFTTEAAVTYYTLTVSCDPAEGGSVALAPEQPAGGYEAGTSVQLTATANEDYAFGSWGAALSGSTNPDTITMDSNKSVTANFVVFSAPANVDVAAADPGVESIHVIAQDLSEVDVTDMPEGVEAQEAYVVDSTGTGSFTLRFTDVANAENVVLYKVVDSTWTEIPITAITVIDATTIEVTMEVGDPVLVFGLPTAAPPPPAVGGTAYPPNKLLVSAPWIALIAAIIAGAAIFVRRRRAQG